MATALVSPAPHAGGLVAVTIIEKKTLDLLHRAGIAVITSRPGFRIGARRHAITRCGRTPRKSTDADWRSLLNEEPAAGKSAGGENAI